MIELANRLDRLLQPANLRNSFATHAALVTGSSLIMRSFIGSQVIYIDELRRHPSSNILALQLQISSTLQIPANRPNLTSAQSQLILRREVV